jgi:parallel beta-helix repeat protein
MKKSLTCLIAILLLTGTALCETYRYSPGQSHLLPQAFANLESGDRVVLERGNYTLEHGLKLNDLSNVTIEGQGRVTLQINDLDSPVLEIMGCTDVTIKQLRLSHKNPGSEYQCEGAVIKVANSEKVLVARNHLNGCGAAGVYAVQSKQVCVYQNRIYNNTYAGIWLTDSQILVDDNDIYDNAAALSTYGECDVTFTGNRIRDNAGNDYVRGGYFERAMKDL